MEKRPKTYLTGIKITLTLYICGITNLSTIMIITFKPTWIYLEDTFEINLKVAVWLIYIQTIYLKLRVIFKWNKYCVLIYILSDVGMDILDYSSMIILIFFICFSRNKRKADRTKLQSKRNWKRSQNILYS